jgi:hypothetical protein
LSVTSLNFELAWSHTCGDEWFVLSSCFIIFPEPSSLELENLRFLADGLWQTAGDM